MSARYFVTAIGTDSGKTVVSALLCRALKGDYWKPIQAGLPKDSELVKRYCQKRVFIHKETYCLREPAAPVLAAEKENILIQLTDFKLPHTQNPLVIEGAGGCLVPINRLEYVIDIAARLRARVVVVANLYLGCINHSLLTFHWLQSQKNIKVAGMVLNHANDPKLADLIERHSPYPCLLRLPTLSSFEAHHLLPYAKILAKRLKQV